MDLWGGGGKLGGMDNIYSSRGRVKERGGK